MEDKCLLRFVMAMMLSTPAISGCTLGPNFLPPPLSLPAQFTEHKVTPQEISRTDSELASWWRTFNDPVLNSLVGQAIGNNLDLQIASQRLLEARAERDEAAAGYYPVVSMGGLVDRGFSSTNLEYPPGNGNYHGFEAGFDASWELDIFGETRRATEAATYDVQASIGERRALLVSLLSEVSADYATLRATQLLLSIANDNVRDAQQTLNFAERELVLGLGTDVETLQAKSVLERTDATLPPLEAEIAVMSHAIAVLLGKDPGQLETQLDQPMPPLNPESSLPVTVPIEVIGNRPDVLQAEMFYAAANARIGVAIAARYPQVSIPISITPEASAINQLFTGASLAFNAALSVSQPVYEGGRLTARVREAKATAEAARLAYLQSVLSALQDVEDALVRVQTDRVADASLVASARDSQAALDHATRLYGAGLEDFLTVLTAETTLFAARDAVASNELALVQDYIALYKAMGGGWQKINFG